MSNKEKINDLREELNESILKNEDYSKIYNLSISLDNLIAEYYEKSLENKEKALWYKAYKTWKDGKYI